MRRKQMKASTENLVTMPRAANELLTPAAALAEARAAPRLFRGKGGICLSDYADCIVALRGRGYTWRGVTQWLENHGLQFSYQYVYQIGVGIEKAANANGGKHAT
jgi:hypothetical protein